MGNPLNHGSVIGRVSQDIKEFVNGDGSKTLLVTVAADDNFLSGTDRKAKTQFVPLRVFLAKSVNGRGSWDRVGKGDLIAVDYRISAAPFEKNGEMVYPAPTLEVDGFPQFLEPKSITEARAAKNAVAAPAAPVDESDADKIARLTAQLAEQSAPVTNYDETSPFQNA